MATPRPTHAGSRPWCAPWKREPRWASAPPSWLFDRRDHLHSAGDGYTRGGAGQPGALARRRSLRRGGGGFRRLRRGGRTAGSAGRPGGFDEWLHSYLKDVDLSWRAQPRVSLPFYVPQARVYHQVSATSGGVRPSYYCGRNFLLVLASDVPASLLRRHWGQVLRQQREIVLEACATSGSRRRGPPRRLPGRPAGPPPTPYAGGERVQGAHLSLERLEALLSP